MADHGGLRPCDVLLVRRMPQPRTGEVAELAHLGDEFRLVVSHSRLSGREEHADLARGTDLVLGREHVGIPQRAVDITRKDPGPGIARQAQGDEMTLERAELQDLRRHSAKHLDQVQQDNGETGTEREADQQPALERGRSAG